MIVASSEARNSSVFSLIQTDKHLNIVTKMADHVDRFFEWASNPANSDGIATHLTVADYFFDLDMPADTSCRQPLAGMDDPRIEELFNALALDSRVTLGPFPLIDLGFERP